MSRSRKGWMETPPPLLHFPYNTHGRRKKQTLFGWGKVLKLPWHYCNLPLSFLHSLTSVSLNWRKRVSVKKHWRNTFAYFSPTLFKGKSTLSPEFTSISRAKMARKKIYYTHTTGRASLLRCLSATEEGKESAWLWLFPRAPPPSLFRTKACGYGGGLFWMP